MSSRKDYHNIKVILLGGILFASMIYGFWSFFAIMIVNDNDKSLVSTSLLLDRKKVYLYTTQKNGDIGRDTVRVSMGARSFPDSLCVLYYDKAWKLKLGGRIRNNDKDIDSDALYPWCCLMDDKNENFFKKNDVVDEAMLERYGVKFNFTTGTASDRLKIKISKKDEHEYLTSNFAFFNTYVRLNKNVKNVVELDLCNSTDTLSNKNAFVIPMLGKNGLPERRFIEIHDDIIRENGTDIKKYDDDNSFEVAGIHFEIRQNYSRQTIVLLSVILLYLTIVSLLTLMRYGYYLDKNNGKKNAVVIVESSILQLRILFNSMLFLGLPLLLIKIGMELDRLYWYGALVIILNLNVVWFFKKYISNEIREKVDKIYRQWHVENAGRLVPIIIMFGLIIPLFFVRNELVFGKIPVLQYSKMLYVLIPVMIGAENVYVFRFARMLHFLKPTHYPYISYLIMFFMAILISLLTFDFATILFTAGAVMFMALFVFFSKKVLGMIEKFRAELVINIIIIIVVAVVLYALLEFVDLSSLFQNSNSKFASKFYRVFSTLWYPDTVFFNGVDNQARETVTQQIMLLKNFFVGHPQLPRFDIIIPGSWRSTFFSDYAVLWELVIGGYYFLFIYLLVIGFLVYSVGSIMIFLNNKIKLKGDQITFYDKRLVIVFNVLLSIFVVQYVYTLMSNMWVFPVTGQSPGLLSPSNIEILYHSVLINGLYFFLEKREHGKDGDAAEAVAHKQPEKSVYYSSVLNNSKRIFFGVIVVLSVFVVRQIGNIVVKSDVITLRFQDERSHVGVPDDKDEIRSQAIQALQKKDYKLYKILHGRYYNGDMQDSLRIQNRVEYVQRIFRDDSLYYRQFSVPGGEHPLYYVNKNVNGVARKIIQDKYYSGFPIRSNTVNLSLQRDLNIALERWAAKLKKQNNGYYMTGGSIMIIHNDNGNILVSASYPAYYNDNMYHLEYEVSRTKKSENYILSNQDIENYVNFAECDLFPGSIVKPLLAYAGLRLLDNPKMKYANMNLDQFIGTSNDEYAEALLRDNVTKKGCDSLNAVLKNELGVNYYYTLVGVVKKAKKDNALMKSYAIGLQDVVPMKNVLQAYARIKRGYKINPTYYERDEVELSNELGMSNERLDILRNAMKKTLSVKGATASDVRDMLKVKSVLGYDSFLAKTGTAEKKGRPDHNITSSFIIVTDNYAIGIQLFGDIPNNKKGYAARHLFIDLIDKLKTYKVL